MVKAKAKQKKEETSKTVKTGQVMHGVVRKKSGDKTVAVEVSRVIQHPLYERRIARVVRYLVHDLANEAKIGETVTIKETRPLSARKRWVIVK